MGTTPLLSLSDDVKTYLRVTELIDCLDDTSGLDLWQKRQILRALVIDWDDDSAPENSTPLWTRLRKAVRKDYADDAKWLLNGIIFDANKVADTGRWARGGTSLHKLTEYLDSEQGWDHPGLAEISDDNRASLRAYEHLLHGLDAEVLYTEKNIVNDAYRARGRMDRGLAVTLPSGRRRIAADVKTGGIYYGNGKLAMQLFAYASGHGYERGSDDREALHLDQEIGGLIHLPQDEPGRADFYEIDLITGRVFLDIAFAVHNVYRGKSGDVRPDEALLRADENGLMTAEAAAA